MQDSWRRDESTIPLVAGSLHAQGIRKDKSQVNYLAHGRHVTGDPYVLAGTALPDWLGVADRRVRIPARKIEQWRDHPDPFMNAVARGVMRHHRDDDLFHHSIAFLGLCGEGRRQLDKAWPEARHHVTALLAHISIELLLDAEIARRHSNLIDLYYAGMDEVDPARIQSVVATITGRQVDSLSRFIDIFRKERFLHDYGDDARLDFRLRQVFRRIGIGSFPNSVRELWPRLRQRTAEEFDRLLPTEAQPLDAR